LEDLQLIRAVERFLYREADLMDSHRYDDWFALWDEELRYWVPCNADDIDPARQVSLIYDNRGQLEDRLYRLKGRHAHAQRPRSRLMRAISNVIVESADSEIVKARSQFVLGEVRLDRQIVWLGRSLHTLVRRGDNFMIREKTVLLLNNDAPMGNLTFLI